MELPWSKLINRFEELCLGCFCPGKPNFQLLHICHDKGLVTSQLKHNGPAIKGGCVPEYSGWRTFCRHDTNFIEHYECRDTKFIGAASLSPVTNLVAGTGAVSRRVPRERSEQREYK
jgi:hypothetical protein